MKKLLMKLSNAKSEDMLLVRSVQQQTSIFSGKKSASFGVSLCAFSNFTHTQNISPWLRNLQQFNKDTNNFYLILGNICKIGDRFANTFTGKL